MRRWIAGLTAFLLVFVLNTAASATPDGGDGYRVALSRDGAAKAGLAVRHGLPDGRVTADVTDAQLSLLKSKGLTYERIPVRTADGTAAAKGDRKQSRSLPPSQVPYGVKMIYGSPDLTAASVSGGAGLTVAVLDTGSVSHPDFIRADGSNVITGCVDFTQKKAAQVEGVCADGNGHGTHVTGTIAAAGGLDGKGLFGVAPDANVLSYKVLNDRGSGYADDIALGIRTAADRGANIISMSFGSTDPSQLELDAIRYAVSRGVLVIAAAGNLGPNPDTISYPAAYAEVVAVAALSPDESVADFSSRGLTDGNDRTIADREVEVAAPGRNTLSTYKDGAYAIMSGTSMATPHVSGLSARMWQGSADRTRDWLRKAASAHDILQAEQVDNAGPGYDIAAGYGLPQVQALSLPLWN